MTTVIVIAIVVLVALGILYKLSKASDVEISQSTLEAERAVRQRPSTPSGFDRPVQAVIDTPSVPVKRVGTQPKPRKAPTAPTQATKPAPRGRGGRTRRSSSPSSYDDGGASYIASSSSYSTSSSCDSGSSSSSDGGGGGGGCD